MYLCENHSVLKGERERNLQLFVRGFMAWDFFCFVLTTEALLLFAQANFKLFSCVNILRYTHF